MSKGPRQPLEEKDAEIARLKDRVGYLEEALQVAADLMAAHQSSKVAESFIRNILDNKESVAQPA